MASVEFIQMMLDRLHVVEATTDRLDALESRAHDLEAVNNKIDALQTRLDTIDGDDRITLPRRRVYEVHLREECGVLREIAMPYRIVDRHRTEARYRGMWLPVTRFQALPNNHPAHERLPGVPRTYQSEYGRLVAFTADRGVAQGPGIYMMPRRTHVCGFFHAITFIVVVDQTGAAVDAMYYCPQNLNDNTFFRMSIEPLPPPPPPPPAPVEKPFYRWVRKISRLTA